MIYLKEYIKLWFPINYIPFFLGVQLIFCQDAISGSKNNSNSNEFVSINELENQLSSGDEITQSGSSGTAADIRLAARCWCSGLVAPVSSGTPGSGDNSCARAESD